jgi:hypothetical protein
MFSCATRRLRGHAGLRPGHLASKAGHFSMGLMLLATLSATSSCGPDRATSAVAVTDPIPIPESPSAHARIEDLRARFVLPVAAPQRHGPTRHPQAGQALALSHPALGPSEASRFELRNGSARALIPSPARLGTPRTATVDLPMNANQPVRLEDDTSHVAVSFTLRGAGSAAITTAAGIAVYPRSAGGGGRTRPRARGWDRILRRLRTPPPEGRDLV